MKKGIENVCCILTLYGLYKVNIYGYVFLLCGVCLVCYWNRNFVSGLCWMIVSSAVLNWWKYCGCVVMSVSRDVFSFGSVYEFHFCICVLSLRCLSSRHMETPNLRLSVWLISGNFWVKVLYVVFCGCVGSSDTMRDMILMVLWPLSRVLSVVVVLDGGEGCVSVFA